MTIEAKVICDSISDAGIRLITFQLRYPRFIHAELMTHRVFSRNASSSRAIPVARMIEDLRRDPAMPIYWGSNKPGMQAGDEVQGEALEKVKEHWLLGMNGCIATAERLMELGLHKQIANRILEPWAHINVILSATDYRNFYTLRRHPDAQPEIKELADCMWIAECASTPNQLSPGQWHLPYIRSEDLDHKLTLQKKISVARCARVSYLTHDGKQTTAAEDIALYDRLLNRQPVHASPAEHQATPLMNHNNGSDPSYPTPCFKDEHLSGNFRGWCQLRKMLEGEFVPG